MKRTGFFWSSTHWEVRSDGFTYTSPSYARAVFQCAPHGALGIPDGRVWENTDFFAIDIKFRLRSDAVTTSDPHGLEKSE